MSRYLSIASPIVSGKEIRAVKRVLKSGNLVSGEEVLNFENEFARVISVKYAIAVNSGTSALHLSLLALGIGPGHEVIVPSFTFAATANAVALTGATPIFADIDPHNFCLSLKDIYSKVSAKTKAVIPVHLFGHPADLIELSKFCRDNNLYLIEDAAQAHLAAIDGKNVGTIGDIGIFSFYPSKNMTTGEGGMVVTNSYELDERVRLLRNQGMKKKYENVVVGLNNRMTDIQAAIGREQLKKIDKWIHIRKKNALRYNQQLSALQPSVITEGIRHVYNQYTIRVPKEIRGGLVDFLQEKGIQTAIYYPTPLHKLPIFDVGDSLPESEKASTEVLSLPVHPRVRSKDVDFISDCINYFLHNKGLR